MCPQPAHRGELLVAAHFTDAEQIAEVGISGRPFQCSRVQGGGHRRVESVAVVSEQQRNVVLHKYEPRALGAREFLAMRGCVRETREELTAARDPLDADAEPPLRLLSGERAGVHFRERLTRDDHIAASDKQRPASSDAFHGLGRRVLRREPMPLAAPATVLATIDGRTRDTETCA